MRDYHILKEYAPWRNFAYGYLTAGHNSDVECLLGKLYVLHTYLKQKEIYVSGISDRLFH